MTPRPVVATLLRLVEHGDYNLSRSAALAMAVSPVCRAFLDHLLGTKDLKYGKEIRYLLSL